MACTSIDLNNWEDLCKIKPANITVSLVKGLRRDFNEAGNDEYIDVYSETPLPCASTIDFGNCSCVSGYFHIYTNAEELTDTCTGKKVWRLSGIREFIPVGSNCSMETDLNLAEPVKRNQPLNIGNTSLPFWSCVSCTTMNAVKEENRLTAISLDQLKADVPNPVCGSSAVIINGGTPLVAVAVWDGVSCKWKIVSTNVSSPAGSGGLGSVSLFGGSNTTVYNVGGSTLLDNFVNGTTLYYGQGSSGILDDIYNGNCPINGYWVTGGASIAKTRTCTDGYDFDVDGYTFVNDTFVADTNGTVFIDLSIYYDIVDGTSSFHLLVKEDGVDIVDKDYNTNDTLTSQVLKNVFQITNGKTYNITIEYLYDEFSGGTADFCFTREINPTC